MSEKGQANARPSETALITASSRALAYYDEREENKDLVKTELSSEAIKFGISEGAITEFLNNILPVPSSLLYRLFSPSILPYIFIYACETCPET
ncbi:MAG: hypothetical protein ACYCYE_16095 [Clostridia bacterium]